MTESSQNVESEDITHERLLSLDFFKGLTILLMVFVNSINQFTNTPAWTKHAVDFGLTYVDLIAPFFIFMMALNYKSSFQRRLKASDESKVYLKFFQRYLIFLGLGLVLYIDLDSAGNFIFRWGTLQVLGVSGLILLPLIVLPAIARLGIGFGGLILHQYLLETGLKQIIYDGIEGGIFGSLSWACMLIISSVLAEGLYKYLHESKSDGYKTMVLYFFFGGIILTTMGIVLNSFSLLNFNFVISRQYVSPSYILISAGISSLVFYSMYYLIEILGKKHDLFIKDNFVSKLGRNSFFLFIIHILLISMIIPVLPVDMHVILVFVIGFINVLIIWVLGFSMYKAEVFIVI